MKVLGSVYESEYYVKQCISTEGVKNLSHEFLHSGTKTTINMNIMFTCTLVAKRNFKSGFRH